MDVPRLAERYRIARRLGVGGYARVYLCWDERLHVWCAVKVMLDDDGVDEVLRKRFVQEARTLARLAHPNVVRLYDLFDDVPTPFLVMEFLEGGTLRDRLLDAPLHPAVAASAMADVASALAAAHGEGIVHRDVKPHNVMLDRYGTVKLGDFGVARVARAGLTSTALVLGTRAYMPPEQQETNEVDPRADVYAAGATLYTVLVRKRPVLLLTAQREEALLEVPEALRPIVRRATAPRASDRFADGAELEEALREVLRRIPPPDDASPLVPAAPPLPDPPAEADPEEPLEPGELDGTSRTAATGAPVLSQPFWARWPFLLATGALVVGCMGGCGGGLGFAQRVGSWWLGT